MGVKVKQRDRAGKRTYISLCHEDEELDFGGGLEGESTRATSFLGSSPVINVNVYPAAAPTGAYNFLMA